MSRPPTANEWSQNTVGSDNPYTMIFSPDNYFDPELGDVCHKQEKLHYPSSFIVSRASEGSADRCSRNLSLVLW